MAFSHDEEKELGSQLVVMDEIYFLIQDVEMNRGQNLKSPGQLYSKNAAGWNLKA